MRISTVRAASSCPLKFGDEKASTPRPSKTRPRSMISGNTRCLVRPTECVSWKLESAVPGVSHVKRKPRPPPRSSVWNPQTKMRATPTNIIQLQQLQFHPVRLQRHPAPANTLRRRPVLPQTNPHHHHPAPAAPRPPRPLPATIRRRREGQEDQEEQEG